MMYFIDDLSKGTAITNLFITFYEIITERSLFADDEFVALELGDDTEDAFAEAVVDVRAEAVLDEAAGMLALHQDVREVAVGLMPEGDGHACAIAGSFDTIFGEQRAGKGTCEERVFEADASVGARANDEHILAQ